MPGLELSFLISQETTGRGDNPLYTNQYPFYVKGWEIDRMTNESTSVQKLASSDLSQDETRYQLSSQSPASSLYSQILSFTRKTMMLGERL